MPHKTGLFGVQCGGKPRGLHSNHMLRLHDKTVYVSVRGKQTRQQAKEAGSQ